MKLLLVCVGRADRPFSGAIAEYERRASRYWKLRVEEVKAGASGRRPAEAVRAAEGERIRAALPETADRWCLTREGSPWASEEWARRLGSQALHGGRDIALVMGGAHGLDPELLNGASEQVSLGPVTLPHELARLVLVEQLYRAGTILRNEPYHKGPR